MSNSLDKLLQRPDTNKPELVKNSGAANTKEEYKGDEGKDRANGWLEFWPLKGPRLVCSYAQLREFEYNGPDATCITLYFSFRVVTIKGRKLSRLVTGLHSRSLTVVEQFNPLVHTPPTNDAPVIETIEMMVPGPTH